MNKDNAKALKGLFFPVRKEEASKYTKNLEFTRNRNHYIIITKSDGKDLVVNSCSPSYSLISNEELITPVVEGLEKEFDLKIHATNRGYSRFFVDFVMQDQGIKLKKDQLFPRIRLNNSYDGGVKYSYQFGFYRLVCENGLTAPVTGVKEFRKKFMHTPAMDGGRALAHTLEAITEFVGESRKIADGYLPLMESKLSIEAAMERLEETISSLKYPRRQAEFAADRLQKEANMGLPINDFLVYNALNFALYQNDSKMKDHKRDGMDLRVLTHLLNS